MDKTAVGDIISLYHPNGVQRSGKQNMDGWGVDLEKKKRAIETGSDQ